MNKLYILVLGILIVSSCTTQKKRSDQSALSKAWHNTNAHYNGYFHADETISESILLLNEQHEDNYLKLLDVYEYTEVNNPQAVAEALDEAVKKVTIVVNLHPYSQWSDDCYFIAGQALYLKQDYEGAEKAFRFLINEYPPLSKEVSKKERRNGNKSGRSTSSRSTRSNDNSSSTTKPLSQRDKEKARKAYNREVARKKKQRDRDRRQGKTTPRAPRETTSPGVETPSIETPTPVEETSSTEDGRTGPIRLSNNAETAVDQSTQNYKMKHRPAFQEGQLWLARTFIERDNYRSAHRILNQLNENAATFKDIRREVAVAEAHLAIKEGYFAEATVALDKAIDSATDKEAIARLAFILGQLQQQLGNSSAAYAAFEQVVKVRPNYVMEFAARLNMAQNAYKAGGGNSVEALANLEKLLKDDKNLPYQDQIYFAMARIALDQGNEEEGLAYMQKSLASSTSNRAQKAEAYYYLGTLYNAKEAYLSAKLYYDSTLTLMPQTDERFGDTKRLRDNLVDIATNIEIITLQDSLLLLKDLTEEERAELAKKLTLQERAESTKKTVPSSNRFGGMSTARPGVGSPALQTASEFWAYNERNKKRSAREFKNRWGSRVLEDDWRRSSSIGSSIPGTEAVEEVDVNLLTIEEINKILADIPTTDGEKRKAELEIKKAMFNLGRLYRDRMENNEKCVEILEELNERFPGNLHELDSWYYLYVAYVSLNNTTKAKEYKDKILQKYPSSSYGQILINPNYAQEQLNEELRLNHDYDAVYLLFERGQYEDVLRESEKNANSIIGDHLLKPRYALLKAMSLGNTKGKEAYILELQKLIATYKDKDVPEKTRAKEILRLLGGSTASLPGGEQEEAHGNFKVNDAELHYILIVFDSEDIDLNANKIAVSDYNKTYHSLDRIRISNVYLGNKNDVPVLVLRRFKDKDKGLEYYNGLVLNGEDFIDPAFNAFKVLPISQSNYREVLRNRSIDGYEAFFQDNY